VVFLVLFIVLVLCIYRKRAAKVIKPWKTGISGQLQKAFVTGNTAISEFEHAIEQLRSVS
jgi:hypothetical protein